MIEQISSDLERSALSCSDWSMKYRVMGTPFPGPWTFDHHPWLYEMHNCEAEEIVGQKAAQMGYTEWAINKAFYNMDVKGLDVLYVLPSEPDATAFTMTRFDPALEMSEHLRKFFSDVNNTALKRAGNTSLYVRGSRSRSKLKSIPTAVIILDEVDEMPEENVSLVEERMSGQAVGTTQLLKLSTPSFEDFGINRDFKLSTQSKYVFQCPGCSKYIDLDFESLDEPKNLVITADSLTDPRIQESYFKCIECDRKIEFEEKKELLLPKDLGGTAHFIDQYKDRDKKGFYVNQLYSSSVSGLAENLAMAVLLGEQNPSRKQELYNSKLGKTHDDASSQVTDEALREGIGSHKIGEIDPTKLRTMGVDVGVALHVVIYEWTPVKVFGRVDINDRYVPKLVYAGEIKGNIDDFSEVIRLFQDYRCKSVVIDAEPERRMSSLFVRNVPGKAYTCDYLFSVQSRQAVTSDDELIVKVNRTAWLDLTLSRYRLLSKWLPKDLPKDFNNHIKASKRTTKIDKWGAPYGVYVNQNDDHYAHAANYAEIALPLATGQTVQEIREW